jgi:zinc protease
VYTSAGYGGSSLDDTSFGLSVVPAAGVSLSEVEQAMDDAVAEFMKNPIDPDDMTRIRNQLRASEIYAKDNTQGLARRYGAALTQGLTIQDVQDWPDILQAVTEDDIKAVAAKVLNKNQAVTGWVVANEEDAQ